MANILKKGQTIINKTPHMKLNTEQHEHNWHSGWPQVFRKGSPSCSTIWNLETAWSHLHVWLCNECQHFVLPLKLQVSFPTEACYTRYIPRDGECHCVANRRIFRDNLVAITYTSNFHYCSCLAIPVIGYITVSFNYYILILWSFALKQIEIHTFQL